PASGAARRWSARANPAHASPRGDRLMLSQEFMRNALLAGTFVALACGGCGACGRGALARAGARRSVAVPADDAAIGTVFTAILGLGVFFLTLFSTSSAGGAGIQAAHTLFGSIFGLGAVQARLAAVIAALATGLML